MCKTPRPHLPWPCVRTPTAAGLRAGPDLNLIVAQDQLQRPQPLQRLEHAKRLHVGAIEAVPGKVHAQALQARAPAQLTPIGGDSVPQQRLTPIDTEVSQWKVCNDPRHGVHRKGLVL